MTLQADVLLPKLATLSRDYRERIFFPLASKILGSPVPSARAILQALADPRASAMITFGIFGFARAGAEQAGYGDICVHLLRSRSEYRDENQFLDAFRAECQSQNIGPNEKLNSGVVSRIYQQHFGSSGPVAWLMTLGQRIRKTGQLRPIYMDLLSIRGIGPKIAAFLLRDVVWIFDCEKRVSAVERVLIQPIDTWVRQIGESIWPEFEEMNGPTKDFLLALCCCSATADLRLSDVEFNQGCWYFGSQVVRPGGNVRGKLKTLGGRR